MRVRFISVEKLQIIREKGRIVLDWSRRYQGELIYMYVCTWIYEHMISPSSVYMRKPRSSDTPEAMSTPSTQNLVSKNHYPIKGIRAPWRSG